MWEGILREIEEADYPLEAVKDGLKKEGITDACGGAAFGYLIATEMITELIRNRTGDDGWIPCSERNPAEDGIYPVTPDGDPLPVPAPYRPRKAAGEDYRSRIMERFMKTE